MHAGCRRAARQILHAGLSEGWSAWREMCEARALAWRRLREVGNCLHAPELSRAFDAWGQSLAEERQRTQRSQLSGAGH